MMIMVMMMVMMIMTPAMGYLGCKPSDPCAESPELPIKGRVLITPGISQNIVVHASTTAGNFHRPNVYLNYRSSHTCFFPNPLHFFLTSSVVDACSRVGPLNKIRPLAHPRLEARGV